MPAPPNASHIALGFSVAPTIAQLKRFVFNTSHPIDLRKNAMIEVASRTSKRVTWLREVARDKAIPLELRQSAERWIVMIKAMRSGRAFARRHGLW